MVQSSSATARTEKIVVCVDSICSCGKPLAREDSARLKYTEISLVKLAEEALSQSLHLQCNCGRKRHGYSYVSYWLPGSGPWVVAEMNLQTGDFLISSRVKPVRLGVSSEPVTFLPTDEMEAAHVLGQPLNPRAAWNEAVFQVQLGADEVSFPYGPGMRAVVSKNPPTQDTHSLLNNYWLNTSQSYCFVDINDEVVHEEIAMQAEKASLQAKHTGQNLLRLEKSDIECYKEISTVDIVEQALKAGVSVAAQANALFESIALTLQQMQSHKEFIVNVLSPDSSHVRDNILYMKWKKKTLEVDLLHYTSSSFNERKRSMNSWKEKTK